MKLKNKKTGEIKDFALRISNGDIYNYSLAELNEEWEDYEEPKGSALDLMILTLTNFIENEPDEDKVDLEDCEQMLEKLKAWKRLKEAKIDSKLTEEYDRIIQTTHANIIISFNSYPLIGEDLNLLFGGEE